MSRVEDQIQEAIFDHYLTRGGDGVFAFSVPNAGKRSFAGASSLKKTGLTPGVPDTIWIKEGQAFALEVKTGKGKISDDQAEVIEEMESCGTICHVAFGLDDAIRWLESNRLLKGRAA